MGFFLDSKNKDGLYAGNSKAKQSKGNLEAGLYFSHDCGVLSDNAHLGLGLFFVQIEDEVVGEGLGEDVRGVYRG